MTEQTVPSPPVEWLRQLAAEARFGAGDRRGTANLIDDAARSRARAAIVTADSVSLSRPMASGPSMRADGRPAFSLEIFHQDGPIIAGSDHLELDCHSHLNTHLDGLNHMGMDGTWYSGWVPGDPAAPSIADFGEQGLVTRAVHVDIPAVRGTPWVGVDRPVAGDDIEAALAATGTEFVPGDALLLDMGRDRWEAAGNDFSHEGTPGIGLDGAHWIVDHGVSMVCWDFLDAFHPDQPFVPVHMLLWAIGLILVDNCHFPRLRHALPAGRSTGCLVVAPLPIPGATGNNVNPLVLL
jgi:kynurenine formamidase